MEHLYLAWPWRVSPTTLGSATTTTPHHHPQPQPLVTPPASRCAPWRRSSTEIPIRDETSRFAPPPVWVMSTTRSPSTPPNDHQPTPHATSLRTPALHAPQRPTRPEEARGETERSTHALRLEPVVSCAALHAPDAAVPRNACAAHRPHGASSDGVASRTAGPTEAEGSTAAPPLRSARPALPPPLFCMDAAARPASSFAVCLVGFAFPPMTAVCCHACPRPQHARGRVGEEARDQ
jgi:hypothetical protein